jgi:hypothetical protein
MMKTWIGSGVLLVAVVTPACGDGRRLRAPESIDGVPCERWAWQAEGGRLEGCFLAESADVRGRQLPAGTRIGLDEQGRLDCVFLPEDTEIDGHVCRGHGHDFQTCFHPNGKLRYCNLAAPETIDGVPCQRSGFFIEVFVDRAGVEFHDDGTLRGCLLAGPLELDGQRIERGNRVELDGNRAIVTR